MNHETLIIYGVGGGVALAVALLFLGRLVRRPS